MTRPLLLLVALALFLLAPMPTHAQDATDASSRVVSVSGEGTARAVPDRATVRFGVVTEGEAPEAVREANARAAERALNAVRDLGVAESKIQMQQLTLRPLREYDREARRYEERGYEASRTLVVELDDLDVLPALVARVVQQGANRLSGVSYDLQDREAVRAEALREAATNARAKAALLAETLGASLGPVQSIREQSFSFPRPMASLDLERTAQARSAQNAPSPDAYAAGEIEVSATVQVSFRLE
jgi:hypothetical protein